MNTDTIISSPPTSSPAADLVPTTRSARPRRRRLRRIIVAALGIATLGTVIGTVAQRAEQADAWSVWNVCDGEAQPLLARNNSGGAYVRVRFSCDEGITPVAWYRVQYKKSQSDAAWQNATEWVKTNRRFSTATGLMAQRVDSFTCPRGYDLRVWGWGGYFSGSTPLSIPGAYRSTGVLRC